MGIAGLAGSGQSEVLNLFMGLDRPERGSLTLQNQPAPATPAEAWSRGVAFVPPERRSQGLALRMGARSNALSPHYRGMRANVALETARTAMLATRVNLKAASLEQSVWQLSGGNQQKVLFARAMGATPRLLLLDEPTRGVDIAARAEIYALIRTLSAQGCAVLMASSDLTEMMGLCDRIIVLQAGRQVQILTPHGLGPNDLLQACYATEHVLT
jgi:ABC-type sugar transport system ATPase subunit